MSDEVHAANVNTTSGVEAFARSCQTDLQAMERILGMADRYRADHLLRQAAEMYFEVVDRSKRAPELARARERLLEIAEHYENIGAPHQARGIYERFL
jgi:hypothetical protein